MNSKVCVFAVLMVSCLLVSAQAQSYRRIRVAHGDYDCSCTYHCPSYGVRAGHCNDNDYWGWGVPTYCCIPSYYSDIDTPDMNDNYGFYRGYHGYGSVYGGYRRRK